MVYNREKHKARLISADRYFRQPVSRTFHGRDIFAPVAAHIAAGIPAARVGKLIHDHLKSSSWKPQRTGKRTWTGLVLHIDRFGNIVTNFEAADFPDLEMRSFALRLGPREVSVLARTYAECGPAELFAIAGSSGYLEVSVNQASAAKAVGCEPGAPAELVIG
jgi:hypothetical protein